MKGRANRQASAQKASRSRAADREVFINMVEELVPGAMIDFYRAMLAMKNGRIRWVEQWTREVFLALEHRMVSVVIHHGEGLQGGARAFRQAIANVRKQDRIHRKYAERRVRADFGLNRLRVRLGAADARAFWSLVDWAAGPCLELLRQPTA